MSDGVLTILEGSHLRAVDLTLPETDASLTGAQVLDLAVSKAFSSLFGLLLPLILTEFIERERKRERERWAEVKSS
ncbi:hypothetical protein FF1_044244 [Malus domestica]